MSEFDGIWAVVKVAGGQYLGALQVEGNGIVRTDTSIISTVLSARDARKEVKENGCIFMKPCFEFTMLMKPTPEGIQRQPLPVPVNVCMEEVGVWLWPASIVFFEDMTENDQRSHKSLVEAALKDIMVSRAAAAGLTLDSGARFG